MDIRSATGSEGPDAEIHDTSRLGTSAAQPNVDMRHMRWAMSRFLSLPIRAMPQSAVATLADRFAVMAQRLESRLRDRAVNALENFRVTLTSEAMRASGRFPGLGTHPEVAFALEELGPRRIAVAQQTLHATDDRDYDALVGFLGIAVEGLRYDIDQAEDAEEVADSLLRVLDSVHDYLLARRLVGASYRWGQAERSGVVFQVGLSPQIRSRVAGLLAASPATSTDSWRRHARRAQLVSRQFSSDEPKQPVSVA